MLVMVKLFQVRIVIGVNPFDNIPVSLRKIALVNYPPSSSFSIILLLFILFNSVSLFNITYESILSLGVLILLNTSKISDFLGSFSSFDYFFVIIQTSYS